MKYGFPLPSRGPLATPETIGHLARTGEELGYDAVYAGDHILLPRDVASRYPYTVGGEFPGGVTGDWMEQLTLLAFVAGQTSTIRLVTAVLIVPHRNPLVAAKALATLDVLSRGRLVVGIGAGWMREEFEALDLPPFEERGAVTDEYIRAFKELWTSDDPHFEGRYVNFDNISFLPKPVQKPHPPIWVGGESRPALRRTAELADGWNPLSSNPSFPMGTPELLASGIERLASYARRFGRDPSEIETIYRTFQFELTDSAAPSTGSGQADDRLPFVGNAEQIASDIRAFEAVGASSLVVDFQRQTQDVDMMEGLMERFAKEVWPLV